MLCYGRRVSVRRLEKFFDPDCCNDTPREGRCEHDLQRAAEASGFKLDHVIAREPGELYELLRPIHGPVLACVDHFSHWITVAKMTARHVWILDSARGDKILQRLTWRGFCRRAIWGLPDETVFHLYPLVERS